MTSQSIDTNIYAKLALSQAQRILSLGDLDQNSQTYACFDRYFWHYRQIDFANARFQETVLYLAYLYQFNVNHNPFFNKPAIRNLIEAGIQFWQSIQNRDGSFNEFYPQDRSYSATTHSTLAIFQTCKMLNLTPPQPSIHQACQWLIDNAKLATNQPLELIKAFHTCCLCLNDPESPSDQFFIKQITRSQQQIPFTDANHWDTGTLSNILSSLAVIQKIHQDPKISEIITYILDALSMRITAKGIAPDKSTNRSANLVYPDGLVALNETQMVHHHIATLTQNSAIRPSWLDDRNCIPLAISYLQSYFYQNNDLISKS